MVTSFERIAAAVAASAAALYVLAALSLWAVIVSRSAHRTDSMIYDRAIAWSALAAQFIAIAAGLLDRAEWDDLTPLFAYTMFAVLLTGLFSVHLITHRRIGQAGVVVFVTVVTVAGLATWLWG